jgi:hypothetical protein
MQDLLSAYKKSLDRVGTLETAKREVDLAKQALDQAVLRRLRIQSCAKVIEDRVDALVVNYRYFAATYNEIRNQIVSKQLNDHPKDCDDLLNSAKGLWKLTNRENEKILDAQISLNMRDIAREIEREKPTGAKIERNKPIAQANGTGSSDTPSDGGASEVLAGDINSSACILKAFHTEVSPVLSSSIEALESALINPNSFVSDFQIGPYADATQVDWTLQKTITKATVSGVNISKFNSAIDDCVSPSMKPADSKKGDSSAQLPEGTPSTTPLSAPPDFTRLGFLKNASFRPLSVPLSSTPQPVQSGTKKNKSKKKDSSDSNDGKQGSNDSGSQQKPSGTSGDDSSTTTRGRRINFGAERFIVSIGMAGTPLGQQEFGKGIGQPSFDASGNPVSGQPITNIVTLKNDSSYRLSPMAFLNTRVFQRPDWINATYATFGITAKSDAPGVRPEYMLGVSQSFFDRHLLFTVGAYAGQQSKLTAGLKVNQTIPSTAMGDIAVDSHYRFRWALAISWRVPGLSK